MTVTHSDTPLVVKLTSNAAQNPEPTRYALFTDLEFQTQCDETPSVSWNREVKPWTERSDSACCCMSFPVDIGWYMLRRHDDMAKWSFSCDKHTHISSLRWTGTVTWQLRKQHISICVKNKRCLYDQKRHLPGSGLSTCLSLSGIPGLALSCKLGRSLCSVRVILWYQTSDSVIMSLPHSALFLLAISHRVWWAEVFWQHSGTQSHTANCNCLNYQSRRSAFCP